MIKACVCMYLALFFLPECLKVSVIRPGSAGKGCHLHARGLHRALGVSGRGDLRRLHSIHRLFLCHGCRLATLSMQRRRPSRRDSSTSAVYSRVKGLYTWTRSTALSQAPSAASKYIPAPPSDGCVCSGWSEGNRPRCQTGRGAGLLLGKLQLASYEREATAAWPKEARQMAQPARLKERKKKQMCSIKAVLDNIAAKPRCKTARARTRQAGGNGPKQAAHVITSPENMSDCCLQVLSASSIFSLTLGTFAFTSVHLNVLKHRSQAIQGGRARCQSVDLFIMQNGEHRRPRCSRDFSNCHS